MTIVVDINQSNKLLIADPIYSLLYWEGLWTTMNSSKCLNLMYDNYNIGKGILISTHKNQKQALVAAYKDKYDNVDQIVITFK